MIVPTTMAMAWRKPRARGSCARWSPVLVATLCILLLDTGRSKQAYAIADRECDHGANRYQPGESDAKSSPARKVACAQPEIQIQRQPTGHADHGSEFVGPTRENA